MFNWIIGIGVPPLWVATVRGFVISCILAIIGVTVVQLGNLNFEVLGIPSIWAPVATAFAYQAGRFLEGVGDKLRNDSTTPVEASIIAGQPVDPDPTRGFPPCPSCGRPI